MSEEKEVKQSEEIVEESVNEEVAEDVVEEVDELAELEKKAQEFEDKYLRAHAEMQNIARRSREERETLVRYRSQDLAKKILPSLDNLERALAIPELDETVKKGLEMVQESLLNALKEEGIEEIKAEGVAFDPSLHQAIQTLPAPNGEESDTVIQVFQKGYQLHERVLRPSMVIVSE